MTIKVTTVLKKINELDKLNIKESGLALGKIVDGHSEYHDQLADAKKKLASISRDLTKCENDYVEATTKRDVFDLFYEQYVKANGGNVSKAFDEFKKQALDKPVEESSKENEHHDEHNESEIKKPGLENKNHEDHNVEKHDDHLNEPRNIFGNQTNYDSNKHHDNMFNKRNF